MQWQRMDWPIMVDSLNLLGVEVVPITLLIDEAGVIRFKGDVEQLDAFLGLEAAPSKPSPPIKAPSLDNIDLRRTSQASTGQTSTSQASTGLAAQADQLFLWGGDERLDEVIAGYSEVIRGTPDDGTAHFRLGVAFRKRGDSPQRQPGDFAAAIEHWGKALELNPNQYIWRRRIQQYGPRLAKPYPFYDWVETARREITARGENPWPLPVEPRGAELATPARGFDVAALPTPPSNADRIRRDQKGYVELEATVVPAVIQPGSSARLHLVFRPGKTLQSHWNNEAEDMSLWLQAPAGWEIDRRHLTYPNPPQLVSDETRRFELEAKSPQDAEASVVLTGYALYYVCEDVSGVCLYRRQDIEVPLSVGRSAF